MSWLLARRLKHRLRPGPPILDVLPAYARWAPNYPPRAHNPLMQLEERTMLALLPENLQRCRCLDLACGSGRYLRRLRERGAAVAVGLDFSANMLAESRRFESGPAVRGTFVGLPFASAAFDWIICGLAVGHTPRLEPVLAEATRRLRPGGLLLYSDFHPAGVAAGWQRTFTTANGSVFGVAHYPHRFDDHRRACNGAGLTIEVVREPALGPAAPEARWQTLPAVLVIRARKLG